MTKVHVRSRALLALALSTLAGVLAGGCGGTSSGTGTTVTPPGDGGGPATPSQYGVPYQGFPSWRERALLVLTNAVRMAPLDWRARYGADFSPSLAGAGALDAYPAVGPVRWDLGLNRSARAHSEDMADHALLGPRLLRRHELGDADPRPTTRSPAPSAENIAAGYPAPLDPRYAMNMWLCDASGAACCADGASCDGHRRNIMSGTWRALGTGYGYAAGAPYQNYWTQDFGGATDAPGSPLVDGSHVFVGHGDRLPRELGGRRRSSSDLARARRRHHGARARPRQRDPGDVVRADGPGLGVPHLPLRRRRRGREARGATPDPVSSGRPGREAARRTGSPEPSRRSLVLVTLRALLEIGPEQLLAHRVVGVVAADAVPRSVNVPPRVLVAREADVVPGLDQRASPRLGVAPHAVVGDVRGMRGDGLASPTAGVRRGRGRGASREGRGAPERPLRRPRRRANRRIWPAPP